MSDGNSESVRISEGDDSLTQQQIVVLREVDGFERRITRLSADFEQRDVASRAENQWRRVVDASVRQLYLHTRRAFHDVVVRDDVTLVVNDDARADEGRFFALLRWQWQQAVDFSVKLHQRIRHVFLDCGRGNADDGGKRLLNGDNLSIAPDVRFVGCLQSREKSRPDDACKQGCSDDPSFQPTWFRVHAYANSQKCDSIRSKKLPAGRNHPLQRLDFAKATAQKQ